MKGGGDVAFDACMMRAMLWEYEKEFPEGKIEKVLEPQNDEIDLLIHQGRVSRRLVFNVGASAPRIQLSDVAKENPKAAPMFCMQLRKHLQGARIVGVSQPGFDRIAVFKVSAFDDMGFPRELHVICEIMGKYANLIVTDADNKIITAMKLIDFAASTVRQVLPGLAYQVPALQEKIIPYEATRAEFFSSFYASDPNMTVEKFITSTFSGVAMQIARELCYRATGKLGERLFSCDPDRLWCVIEEWQELLLSHSYKPCAVFDDTGKPVDYSYMDISYFGESARREYYNSLSELFDSFFQERDRLDRIRQRGKDLINLTENSITRTERKLSLQRETLLESARGEEYRRYGDLITANLYKLKRGESVLVCEDFYREDYPTVSIELDTRLSPSQNAQKMYKLYNKCKTAKEVLAEQIAASESELRYLESVRAFIEGAESEEDLAGIREELYQSGYAARMKGYKPQKQAKAQPHRFVTSGGYTVLVGRNNLQNDYLTFKVADRDDIWFHTKDIPGSHVIMQAAGEEPSEKDYTEAAEIAARYSQATADTVAVDYTRVRNIKKPGGSRPGFVTYKTNYTAYVKK